MSDGGQRDMSWLELMRRKERLHLRWGDEIFDLVRQLATQRDDGTADAKDRCKLCILTALSEHGDNLTAGKAWERSCRYADLVMRSPSDLLLAQQTFADAWNELQAQSGDNKEG